ncbi:MAG: inverse autotransporter beta domain-containing protein [Parachlamydiaceae bacterium]
MKYWHYVLCTAVCGLSQPAISHAESPAGQEYSSQNYECCPQSCYVEPCCAPESGELAYSPLRLNVEGLVGTGIGGNNENAAVELFWAPSLVSESWLPFIDLKWHHLGTSSCWAANAGVGLRGLDPWDRTMGINIFYDHRYNRGTEFNQVGIGLESLGELIDVRVNGYFPFKKTGTSTVLFDDYVGDYFVEAEQFWLPMSGVDAEVGVTMYNACDFRIYGAIGPYYYWNTDNQTSFEKKNAFGGMARFSVQWTDYVTLEVKATYDNLFKTKVQGLLEITLPFEKCFDACRWTSNACANIFLKPVERREVIVLHHSDILWLGNY